VLRWHRALNIINNLTDTGKYPVPKTVRQNFAARIDQHQVRRGNARVLFDAVDAPGRWPAEAVQIM